MPESYTDTPLLTERFDRALVLATEHHARQLRKGTSTPYVAHLLAVCSLVLEMGGDEDEAIGALLHDAVEDGGGLPMLEQIRTSFGSVPADIVLANSDSSEEEKAPWQQRKEAYIAGIAKKSPGALRVSIADKLHNARSILFDYRTHGESVFSRFKTGEGDSVVWYYRSLADAFDARREDVGAGGAAALDELRRVIDELVVLRAAS